MRSIFLVVLLVVSQLSVATEAVTAKVVQAGIYGNGTLIVKLDREIPELNCAKSRFDILKDDENIEKYLSVALAAAASGSDVVVRTSGCSGGNPVMDTSANSLFMFGKNPD